MSLLRGNGNTVSPVRCLFPVRRGRPPGQHISVWQDKNSSEVSGPRDYWRHLLLTPRSRPLPDGDTLASKANITQLIRHGFQDAWQTASISRRWENNFVDTLGRWATFGEVFIVVELDWCSTAILVISPQESAGVYSLVTFPQVSDVVLFTPF